MNSTGCAVFVCALLLLPVSMLSCIQMSYSCVVVFISFQFRIKHQYQRCTDTWKAMQGKACGAAATNIVNKCVRVRQGALADDTTCCVIDAKPHTVSTFKGYSPDLSNREGSSSTKVLLLAYAISIDIIFHFCSFKRILFVCTKFCTISRSQG
jgi:hypothetical protein